MNGEGKSESPDRFRQTRIFGGTTEASRVLAWAGTELVRRQRNPLEGDDEIRERWNDVLVIHVESFELLHQRDQDTIARLAEQGRAEGIVISVRMSAPAVPAVRPWERALDMSGAEYQPYWTSLDQVKAEIDRLLQEIDIRNELLKNAPNSTKKGSK